MCRKRDRTWEIKKDYVSHAGEIGNFILMDTLVVYNTIVLLVFAGRVSWYIFIYLNVLKNICNVLELKQRGNRYAGIREYDPKTYASDDKNSDGFKKKWHKESIGRMYGEFQQWERYHNNNLRMGSGARGRVRIGNSHWEQNRHAIIRSECLGKGARRGNWLL